MTTFPTKLIFLGRSDYFMTIMNLYEFCSKLKDLRGIYPKKIPCVAAPVQKLTRQLCSKLVIYPFSATFSFHHKNNGIRKEERNTCSFSLAILLIKKKVKLKFSYLPALNFRFPITFWDENSFIF